MMVCFCYIFQPSLMGKQLFYKVVILYEFGGCESYKNVCFFVFYFFEKSKHENSSQPTPKHHHHWGISRLYKWDCTNSYELPTSLPKHQIVTNCFVIELALVVLLMKNSDHACWKIQVYWTTGSRHTEIWEPISYRTVWKHKIDKIIDKKKGSNFVFRWEKQDTMCLCYVNPYCEI